MKQNLILRSAILAGFGVAANAGQIGVASLTTFGAESVASGSKINNPTVTYQTAVPINANAKFYVYVHVDNGAALTATSNLTIPNVGAGNNTLTFSSGQQLGTDASTVYFEGTAGSAGVASGALINLSDAGGASDLSSLSALATGGAGVIDVTWSMSNVSDFNGATVPAADVDSAATAPLVKSAVSVTGSIVNSAVFGTSGATGNASAVNEAAVIDLAGHGALQLANNKNNTTVTNLVLGAVTYTVNTNLQNTDGSAMSTGDFGNPSVTVTGDFSPTGTKVWVEDTPACASGGGANVSALTIATGGMSASGFTAAGVFKPATAAAGPGGQQSSGTVFVCAKYSGTVTINPYQSTIASTLPSGAHTALNTTVAAANTYNLKNNGASILLHSYLPNGLAKAAGIQSFVRVVNTSSTSAAVSVAVYDDAAGTLGTSAVLGTIAAHASTTFTSAQVEAATGAIANSNVHSLLLTAPSSNLAAQTLLIGAGGVVADTTAVATYNNGGTTTQSNQ
ncbi:MAG: hypothetical protein JO218_16570 [Burkholderiales bacterium]|nr:hypothetical protein [Burkholderiales bacterium]